MANQPWSVAEIALVRAHLHESDRTISLHLEAAGFDRAARAVEAYRKMILGVIRSGPISTWSPERIDLLTTMWREGHSGAQIAERLGGITRSGVIGKVHRLGLSQGSRRAAESQKLGAAPRRAAARDAQVVPKVPRRKGQPAPSFVGPSWSNDGPIAPTIILNPGDEISSPNARVWTARIPGECAYPVGDVTGADQHSCCNITFGGNVYCQPHAQLTHRPTQAPPTFPKNDRTAKAEPKDEPDPQPLDFEEAA